jgi:hypothetical protein
MRDQTETQESQKGPCMQGRVIPEPGEETDASEAGGGEREVKEKWRGGREGGREREGKREGGRAGGRAVGREGGRKREREGETKGDRKIERAIEKARDRKREREKEIGQETTRIEERENNNNKVQKTWLHPTAS